MADTKKTQTTPDELSAQENPSPEAEEKVVSADTEPVEEASAPADEKKDGALDSFLNREPEKAKKTGKITDSRKKIVILIIAVVAVAALVLILIFLRKHPANSTYQEEHPSAEITLSVDKDGVHEAAVPVDDKGEIKQNGSGSLLTYYPADIRTIDVKNKDGSFKITSETPKGKATVYTLVGFEDYELQTGIADEIATHSAALDFGKIISADGDLADYGLDEPRATVKVAYSDDTTAIIRVGNDAPGESGTYVAFGSGNAVYLVSTDAVSDFLFSVNNMVSLSVTDKVEDSDLMAFSSFTISGSHFDQPITLEPNKDEAIGFAYQITSPRRMFADEVESHDIAGNIRGLYAASVVCVNPDKDQLKTYGMDEPYATAEVSYPDTDITLHTSAPQEDGTVNLYNPDKKIIYSIQLAAVSWAKTSLELLTPENPVNIKIAYVDELSFSGDGADFTLDVTSKTETTTGESDIEQQVTTTTASYNGKDLDTDNFMVFFQNINAIKNLGYTDQSAGDKVLTITLRYSNDRADDTVTVYAGDGKNYLLDFNSERMGSVSKTYIDKLIQGGDNLINGKTVESL